MGRPGERAGRGSRNSKCKGPEVGMNVKEQKMAVWLEYSEQGCVMAQAEVREAEN